MSSEKQLVLVTGASGFVGLHCVREALAAGYRVRASVRNASDAKKTAPIRALQSDTQLLELVSLELQSEQPKWNEAVAGCTYVLHVASPVLLDVKRSQEQSLVVQPVIDGTNRLLAAAAAEPSVKRIVFTSSVAAIMNYAKSKQNSACVFDESDWCDYASAPGGHTGYAESKTREEQIAFAYVETEKPAFDIATVCPGLVTGPLLSNVPTPSAEIVNKLFLGKLPFYLDMMMCAVDVRDVARLHVKAMTDASLSNKRVIAVTESRSIKEYVEILRAEFEPKGYKLPKRKLPNFVIKLTGLFSAQARVFAKWSGKAHTFDNTRMKSVLPAAELHSISDSLIEITNSMIEQGHIPDKRPKPQAVE